MADCADCLKKLVVVFNIIFIVCGLGLLGYGVYLQLTMEGYSALLGVDNINPGTMLIIVGGIMVILGFFGCCGAWQKDNSCGICMLRTFGSLIAILLLIEIIFVLVVYFKQDTIQKHMKGTMEDYNKNATENGGVTEAWDTLQRSYRCCGVGAPRDWDTLLGKSVPDSCCVEESPGCGTDARKFPDDKRIFLKGCYEKLSNDSVLLGGVGGVLLVVQLLAIIIACCMARPKKEYELTSTGD